MLGVDHEKIILLSTLFPIIPILGTNCSCNVICSMLEINDVVLYCMFSPKYHLNEKSNEKKPANCIEFIREMALSLLPCLTPCPEQGN